MISRVSSSRLSSTYDGREPGDEELSAGYREQISDEERASSSDAMYSQVLVKQRKRTSLLRRLGGVKSFDKPRDSKEIYREGDEAEL